MSTLTRNEFREHEGIPFVSFERAASIFSAISRRREAVAVSSVPPEVAKALEAQGVDPKNDWYAFSQGGRTSVYFPTDTEVGVLKGRLVREAAQFAITRYQDFVPPALLESGGFHLLIAAVETAAAAYYLQEGFSGGHEWLSLLEEEKLVLSAPGGLSSQFVEFCNLLALHGRLGEIGFEATTDTLHIYERLREDIRAVVEMIPKDVGVEADVVEKAKIRYMLAYQRLWPLAQKLIENDVRRVAGYGSLQDVSDLSEGLSDRTMRILDGEKSAEYQEDGASELYDGPKPETGNGGDGDAGNSGEDGANDDTGKDATEPNDAWEGGGGEEESSLQESGLGDRGRERGRPSSNGGNGNGTSSGPSGADTSDGAIDYERASDDRMSTGNRAGISTMGESREAQDSPLAIPDRLDRKTSGENVGDPDAARLDLARSMVEAMMRKWTKSLQSALAAPAIDMGQLQARKRAVIHRAMKRREESAASGSASSGVLMPTSVADVVARQKERTSRSVMLRSILPTRQPANYDQTYQKVRWLDEELYRKLEAVFHPNINTRPDLRLAGKRLSMPAVMRWEADRSMGRKLDNRLFERIVLPNKKDYAITLLVDLSGSMTGSKITNTFAAVVLLTEVLNRLRIQLEVLWFQDELLVFKEFGQRLDGTVRSKMSGMVNEAYWSNPGGHNCPSYNDDGPCLLAATERLKAANAPHKFLIPLSDGVPAGRYSGDDDLHSAVQHILSSTDIRLVALGLGSGTKHVESFYPNSIADIDVEQLPEVLGELLMRIVDNPHSYGHHFHAQT